MQQNIAFDVPYAITPDHHDKEERCLQLWSHTIKHVNHVLETNALLDLVEFKTKVHPSVADLLVAIDKAKNLLDLMAKLDGLTHGAATTLLNCSRAISELRSTFDCVIDQDRDQYDACIERLNAILAGPR